MALLFAACAAAHSLLAEQTQTNRPGGRLQSARVWWPVSAVNRGPYFLGVSDLSTWAGLSRREILMISLLPAPKKDRF